MRIGNAVVRVLIMGLIAGLVIVAVSTNFLGWTNLEGTRLFLSGALCGVAACSLVLGARG